LKIIADENMCIGAGACVIAAPGIFDQREDNGIVILLVEEPAPEQLEAVRSAVRQCPSAALSLEE
jgi:ferredoxin